MKLQDFADKRLRYDATQISQDLELSQDVKTVLVDLGFLEVPSDENAFDVGETAALKRFQQEQECDREPDFLGPETAAKLIEIGRLGTRAATNPLTIKTLKETLFKQIPVEDAEVEKVGAPAGKELAIVFYEEVRDYLRVTLVYPLQGKKIWYVRKADISILKNDPAGAEAIHPAQLPKQVKLNVPYKSQRDNAHNPDGSCNVTCLAMCMTFFSNSAPPVKQLESQSGQMEDTLYQYALDQGLSRHDPYDLAKILRHYGLEDRFTESASIAEVKAWLAAQKPAITHGYFTASGHIVALVGYDDTGFLVHDPYGEWCSTGYNRNDPNGKDTKGQYQHYSYDLIKRTCMPDSHFWVHFVSAK